MYCQNIANSEQIHKNAINTQLNLCIICGIWCCFEKERTKSARYTWACWVSTSFERSVSWNYSNEYEHWIFRFGTIEKAIEWKISPCDEISWTTGFSCQTDKRKTDVSSPFLDYVHCDTHIQRAREKKREVTHFKKKINESLVRNSAQFHDEKFRFDLIFHFDIPLFPWLFSHFRLRPSDFE